MCSKYCNFTSCFFLLSLSLLGWILVRKVLPPSSLKDGTEDDFEVDESTSVLNTFDWNDNGDADIEFLSTPAQEKYEPDAFIPLSPSSLAYLVYHHPLNLTKLTTTILSLNKEAIVTRNSGIHLITTFFHGSYQAKRFHELVSTLVSNLENPYISAVHILHEGTDPRYFIPLSIQRKMIQLGLQNKLVLKAVQKQPTYKEMFEYANKHLFRGSIALVSNADIYFDASLKCISFLETKTKINTHTSGRPIFALTRRHSPECSKPDHQNYLDLCDTYVQSHDSFFFAPPIPKAILDRTDHTQNQGYGAENVVIYEFKRKQFDVTNPCLTIHGFHLHCSNERHYETQLITKTRFSFSSPSDPVCSTEKLALY